MGKINDPNPQGPRWYRSKLRRRLHSHNKNPQRHTLAQAQINLYVEWLQKALGYVWVNEKKLYKV